MSVTLPTSSTKDVLSSLSRLSDDPLYHDISLVCRDGIVRWSRFLISANSPFLSSCLRDTWDAEGSDASTVILPDVSSSTLSTLLKCTLNYAVRRDILSVNEQQVMSLLGFSLLRRSAFSTFASQNVVSAQCRTCSAHLASPMSARPERFVTSCDISSENNPSEDDDDFETASVFSDIPILTQDINRDVDSISMISMDARNYGEPILMVSMDARLNVDSITMETTRHMESIPMNDRIHFDSITNEARSHVDSISMDEAKNRKPISETIDMSYHVDSISMDNFGDSMDTRNDSMDAVDDVDSIVPVISMDVRSVGELFGKVTGEEEGIGEGNQGIIDEFQENDLLVSGTNDKEKLSDCKLITNHDITNLKSSEHNSALKENSTVEDNLASAAAEENPRPSFRCSDCGQIFTRALHLLQHAANHKRDQTFVCDICGKIFFHESHLQSHKRYHDDIAKEVKCPECSKTFKGKRALSNHVGLVHEFLKCIHCEEEIPKIKMRKHVKKFHGTKFQQTEFFCHVCEKKFYTSRSLMVHKRTHEGLNGKIDASYVRCNICRKLFACKDHLSMHLKRQHVEIECDVCGKLVKNIKVHQKNVHSPGFSEQMTRTKCFHPECEKEFATAYAAKYHYARAHGALSKAAQKQLCKVCDRSYFDLKRHEREVHSENRFECRTCGNFFPVKQSLERHIQNVHHPTKVACPYCEKKLLHLPGHLVGAHGMTERSARDLAEELTGKAAARTDLQWMMTERRDLPEEIPSQKIGE